MDRFFGMMPSSEIKTERSYKDKQDLTVTIQAGPHGWTVILADSSTRYKDIDNSTDENFRTAYDVAVDMVGELTEISAPKMMRREVQNEA